MVTVLTPPSTADAVSGDDMDSSDQSLESGIEGSIKHCEALLSMLPMTLGKSFDSEVLHETSNKKLRRARAFLNINMKNLMEGLEPEWNRNMGLLSNISMSRDISSSSPASESWRSYSLCTKASTQSSPAGTEEQQPPGCMFMCGAACVTSSSTYGGGSNRFRGGEANSASSADEEEESQSLDEASEDVSNRASSESGSESAESAVTDSSPKDPSQSSSSVVGKLSAATTVKIGAPSFEESLEEEPKISRLEEATPGSMADGDVVPKPSRLEKHASCSSSPTSEPTLMEPRRHKNAAELKPTGLPTNYKKTDAPCHKEWSSSLKLQEAGKSKYMLGKAMRQERLKMHTMAGVARLSAPKVLAAQRVCHVKATPRNHTPLKVTATRLGTASPERSKPRGQKDCAPKYWATFVERFGDIQERIKSSKRAIKIREKEERDLSSFRPNVNCKYLDVECYRPIEKRLDCIRKDKMIKTARDQGAKDLGITFRPELNPHSVRILKEREALKSPAHARCSATPQIYSNNYWPDLRETRPTAGVCTFVPEINANTEHILAGTPLEGCDFLTRQQQFLDRIEQRKRMKQQELASDFTFQPERGNSEFILSCSPLFKINENLSEMCERLSSSDHHRRFCIQQQIADKYYSQFAFHPHVDETSRLIGRNPSFETLHADKRAKYHKDLLRRLAHEEFERTCTFRPMVKAPTSHPKEEATLEEWKRMKLERKKQEDKERMSKEQEELQECTFKPMINPRPPKEPESYGLQIKGVQRHLELQRLAKQMKIDQAEWEKKVFFSHQSNERPRQQYTIPKPFNFHSSTGSCNDSPVNRRNRMSKPTPLDPHCTQCCRQLKQ